MKDEAADGLLPLRGSLADAIAFGAGAVHQQCDPGPESMQRLEAERGQCFGFFQESVVEIERAIHD